MNDKGFCRGCKHKDSCQQAYEQLGNSKTPSIVPKVLVAFVLPLVFFAVTITTADSLLAKFGFSGNLKTAVSFVLATAAVFLYLLLRKLFKRR